MFRRRETVSSHSGENAEKGVYTSVESVEEVCLIYGCASQVWINQGDIVLLSLRDFQDDKADVIVKYTADEARNRTSGLSSSMTFS